MRRFLASVLLVAMLGPVVFGSLPQWERHLLPQVAEAWNHMFLYSSDYPLLRLLVVGGMFVVTAVGAAVLIVLYRRDHSRLPALHE